MENSENNVKVSCPHCGGSVPKEEVLDGVCTCPYCGGTFYIKDIVSQPKVTVNNTVINNNYGSESPSGSISSTLKDIANSYIDAEKEVLKHNSSPKALVSQLLSIFIVALVFIFGWLVFNAMLSTSLSDSSYNSDNEIVYEEENEKTVDLRDRISIVLADGSSQVNGEASIAYCWLDSQDKYSDVQLHAEPSTNLSNGDTVTISISDKGSHQDVTFEPERWSYTVDLFLMEQMN